MQAEKFDRSNEKGGQQTQAKTPNSNNVTLSIVFLTKISILFTLACYFLINISHFEFLFFILNLRIGIGNFY